MKSLKFPVWFTNMGQNCSDVHSNYVCPPHSTVNESIPAAMGHQNFELKVFFFQLQLCTNLSLSCGPKTWLKYRKTSFFKSSQYVTILKASAYRLVFRGIQTYRAQLLHSLCKRRQRTKCSCAKPSACYQY